MRALQTDRLTLRPVTEGDLETLLALRNHPDVIGSTATGEPLPEERMQLQLERWLGLWETRGVGTWIVERDGVPVAFVALDPIGEGYEGVDPTALELGVIVHPDQWGMGIAGEAGAAVVADCGTRGLGPVYATVDPANARSRAVVAKAPGARVVSSGDDEVLVELT